jgi:cytochrome c biogenesis protein
MFLGLLAAVGMVIRQLPAFAFDSVTDYQNQMVLIHARYDPVFTSAGVDILERLEVFKVFTSPWFSIGLVVLVTSIVACTIDRLPRLWRQTSEIRVVQPRPFYDPALAGRVRIADGLTPDAVRRVLRGRRYAVREAVEPDATYVYGDRNRWSKLLTLLTHTGLILFILAAAVTTRLGDERGLVVAEGENLTVQPIGTPGLLLIENRGFDAPGLETGQASDFTTDLAVYRDGVVVAEKTIRVNDPLSVGGYTFHQNGFGPAPVVAIRDGDGRVLWDGAIPLTEVVDGAPFGSAPVPGRPDLGLQLLLTRLADGTAVVLFQPYRFAGLDDAGVPITDFLVPVALAPGERRFSPELDLEITFARVSEFTLLIAKADPGQGLVWLAAVLLLSGIVGVQHLSRRRVWARLDRDGSLELVARADDRSLDFDAELGRLVDDLVAARERLARPGAGGPAQQPT